MIWDPFNTTTGYWEMRSLTDKFNLTKWLIGQAMGLNVVNWESADSLKVVIDRVNEEIGLLDPVERGAPALQLTPDKGDVIDARGFRIAGEETITADSLRDLRVYGTEGQKRGVADAQAKAMRKIGAYNDVSMEHYVLGVLQGIVKKPSNGATILNSYTLFNKAPVGEVNLKLGDSDPAVTIKAINSVVQGIMDALGARAFFVDHIHCFTDQTGFANVLGSPAFRESYKFDSVSEMLRNGRLFQPIAWQQVVWEQYRLGNSGFTGGSFLGTGKFIFFPVMQDPSLSIFQGRFIPSDTFADLELPGQRRYMRSKSDKEFDGDGVKRWMALMGETNPLLYCQQPDALRSGDDGVA